MPRKARRIDQAKIISAATALIAEAGLDALNMRDLGARIGVTASSLYYLFQDKRAIIDAAADEALAPLIHPSPSTAPTIDRWLFERAQLMRTVLLQHPNLIPAMIYRRRLTLRPAMDDAHAQQLHDGVTHPDDHQILSLAYEALAIGSAITEARHNHHVAVLRESGDKCEGHAASSPEGADFLKICQILQPTSSTPPASLGTEPMTPSRSLKPCTDPITR